MTYTAFLLCYILDILSDILVNDWLEDNIWVYVFSEKREKSYKLQSKLLNPFDLQDIMLLFKASVNKMFNNTQLNDIKLLKNKWGKK